MYKTIKQKIEQKIIKQRISIKQKVSIVGLGSISTLLILLMSEVLMAQIITSTILNNIDDNLMLLIIIIGLFLMTIIIAFIVGYFITEDIAIKSVRNASFMSLGFLFLFLFVVANISLFVYHRDVYSEIYGFEILWAFPQVLVLFSIYVLGNVFNLFLLQIAVYYIFFVGFLEEFYMQKEVKISE